MQEGYSQDVYYSFANGEVASIDNSNWDLAFQINGFAASIRINSIKGVELKAIPGVGIEEWANVDTTGMGSWQTLYNSSESWDGGAFNNGLDLNNPFDLGWGVYNQTTHIVSGDSLYMIKLADESIKKLRIDQLSSGVYSFTYADIDGNNEITATVDKANFGGKTFGYYSFSGDSSIDREPDAATWDIVFTRYLADLAPGVKYGVTGVLSNPAVEIARMSNVDISALMLADTTGAPFSTMISTIGYDWKDFSMGGPVPGWVLIDSLAYFVRAQDGETYLINFTEFGGSGNGNISFDVTNVTTSIDPYDQFNTFRVFPNPGNGQFTLNYEMIKPETAVIELMDLSGRKIFQTRKNATTGLQQIEFNHLLLPQGMYLLRLRTPSTQITERLIIN